MELKERGISVNTITSGPTDPPLIDARLRSPEEAAAVRARHAASIPPGCMARPVEIAAAMLFPAANDSGFVTGSELLVDGGMCSISPARRWRPLSGSGRLIGRFDARATSKIGCDEIHEGARLGARTAAGREDRP